MKLVFDNPAYDAQLSRTLGHAPYQGADIQECLATAIAIGNGDVDQWYRKWSQLGDTVLQWAEQSLRCGAATSAAQGFLRASNYYRTAECFVSDDLSRSEELWRMSAESFAQAIPLMRPRALAVHIPLGRLALPGYLFRAGGDGPRPTLITMPGMDGYLEECYFSLAGAALQRGMHCLAFEGPGQGQLARQLKIPFRPDWEDIISAVVDYVLSLDEVDPQRIALVGRCLGGFVAARGACFEKRISALVVDPGQMDIHELAMGLVSPAQVSEGSLDEAYHALQESSKRQHPLTQYMRCLDVQTPGEMLDKARQYTIPVEQITCPTLVCDNMDDPSAVQAKSMHERLECPKDYMLFGNDDFAAGHCQSTGQLRFFQRTFDWLEKTLHIARTHAYATQHA